MWKLLVFVWRDGCADLSRVYVFEFNNETSAKNAEEFFQRGDFFTKVIPDAK